MFRRDPKQKAKPTFMVELDQWTNEKVLSPLLKFTPQTYAAPDGDAALEVACQQVERAIREKVLESYRNGQKKASNV